MAQKMCLLGSLKPLYSVGWVSAPLNPPKCEKRAIKLREEGQLPTLIDAQKHR